MNEGSRTSDSLVAARSLTKTYGSVHALEDATLAVGEGCTALLGENGAGKSTLIKLLLGLNAADSGEMRVLGLDPAHDGPTVRSRVGYFPEHDCLPADWQAQDFVRHMGEVRGLPGKAAVQRASDVLAQVGLAEERYRPIGGFSTGMKQRVKLAQALVHDPALVFLDEPTNGLDPLARDGMLELIRRVVREMGIDVLVSSHLLADVQRIADAVIVLDHGHVAAQGGLRALLADTDTLTIGLVAPAPAFVAGLRAAGTQFIQEPVAEAIEIELALNDEALFDRVRDLAVDTGAGIALLRRGARSLEEVFLAETAAGGGA
jgi:ABC-2 type transport system ATP-binding protein